MRTATGLNELDRLLEGGFPKNTAVLVSGGPGTGKTLLGLQFLVSAASRGEKCCYLSVSETSEELLRACEGIDSLAAAAQYLDKNLVIKNLTLGEKVDLDYFAAMFASYPQMDRLVIDNVNKLLAHARDAREYRLRLFEILNFVKQKVGCTLLLCEAEGTDTGNSEAFECDGVLHLSFIDLEEKPRRILKIHKMRYTAFHPRVSHELKITKKGISLAAKIL